MSNQEFKDKEIEKDFQDQKLENETVENQEDLSEEQVVENELEKLKEDIDKERNNFLRLFAEFENYKKNYSLSIRLSSK